MNLRSQAESSFRVVLCHSSQISGRPLLADSRSLASSCERQLWRKTTLHSTPSYLINVLSLISSSFSSSLSISLRKNSARGESGSSKVNFSRPSINSFIILTILISSTDRSKFLKLSLITVDSLILRSGIYDSLSESKISTISLVASINLISLPSTRTVSIPSESMGITTTP